jgi:hypothetical protein
MRKIVIDRRAFLIGPLAAGAASFFQGGRLAVADELSDWLTIPFAPDDKLLNPQLIKELPPELAGRLGRFAAFLIKSWGLETHVEPNVQGIVADLFMVKSTEGPSYFSEYSAAGETIERARISLASEERAFDLLAFGVIADPESARSRLGRFRRFVFGETARYLIAAGGFRRFKPGPGNAPARNYQGYIAGPFNNPDYLPYRGLTS